MTWPVAEPRRTHLEADALLFDLDGVLIDSTRAITDHWRTVAQWYDLDAEALLAGVHGVRAIDVLSHALEDAGPDVIGQALRRHSRLEIADTAGVMALPGAARLLSEIDPDRWAVVTAGSAPVATARLKAAGLPTPRFLVGADDTMAGKPDPEGYLKAAQSIGVHPSRCVVIEDAPPGILAGRRAGATVLGLTTTYSQAEIADAHVIVPDLASVSVAIGESAALRLDFSRP
jgi:sugar-phosphatase